MLHNWSMFSNRIREQNKNRFAKIILIKNKEDNNHRVHHHGNFIYAELLKIPLSVVRRNVTCYVILQIYEYHTKKVYYILTLRILLDSLSTRPGFIQPRQ